MEGISSLRINLTSVSLSSSLLYRCMPYRLSKAQARDKDNQLQSLRVHFASFDRFPGLKPDLADESGSARSVNDICYWWSEHCRPSMRFAAADLFDPA